MAWLDVVDTLRLRGGGVCVVDEVPAEGEVELKIIRWIFENKFEATTIGFMLFQYVFFEVTIAQFWKNYWLWWDEDNVARTTHIFRIGYITMKNAYVISIILFMFSIKIGIRRNVRP